MIVITDKTSEAMKRIIKAMREEQTRVNRWEYKLNRDKFIMDCF